MGMAEVVGLCYRDAPVIVTIAIGQMDSPIFGYVSSLSPIKPVNCGPIGQVYETIDVPSPQPLFKTPNFVRPRCSALLERSQHLASNSAENISPGYANTMPITQIVHYSDKECSNGDPSPNQPCTSPSKFVDAFLADPLENGDNSSSSPEFCVKRTAKDIDCEKTSCSENQRENLKEFLPVRPHTSTFPVNVQAGGNLHPEQDANPHDSTQNDSVSFNESSVELQTVNMKNYTSRTSEAAETRAINDQSGTEQVRHEDTSVCEHVMDQFLAPGVKGSGSSHIEKETCTTSDYLSHDDQDLTLQAMKNNQLDECTPQLHQGSPHNIQTGNNHIDNSAPIPSTSTGNHTSCDPEDGAQQQRCKRKRLHFESAENLLISNENTFNHTAEASFVDLPCTPMEVETVNASYKESIILSNHKQAIQSVPTNTPSGFSVKVDRCGQYKKGLVTPHRPAGIGLHLNSIVSAAPMNCSSSVPLAGSKLSIQEEKALAAGFDESERSKNYPTTMSLIDPRKLTLSSEKPLYYARNKENEANPHGNQTFEKQHCSVSYQSPMSGYSLNIPIQANQMDSFLTPCVAKNLPSEEANMSVEATQMSPKKKRKKAPENDGQKRCNCKRSKCLKLYCDCFAAGSFCSEACACIDCSNKLEHEETVREMRQHIESRNPLAFAPKVVVRVSDPPQNSEDNKPITPALARHKRGCNCKKSLCVKKYCECFQANVGCSLGCRCEGCKNSFGTKDGCEISEMVVEHKKPKERSWERDLSGELEGIEVKGQVGNTKQCHSRLSPITPLIQSSMVHNATKPQFLSSYFPSPESVPSVARSYESFGANMGAVQNVGLAEDRSESASLISYDPACHNFGKVDSSSPGWEGFPDICNLSPFLKASPAAGGSSSSSKSGERKVLQTKLFEGDSRISLNRLRWRTSPMTPLPQFREGKLMREPDSDSVSHCNPEDDTPEILKETRQPIQSVKATSPNQKRVSPPHHIPSSASAKSPSDLRGCRKYKLQSVPTFPPLTPYSKNKEDGT